MLTDGRRIGAHLALGQGMVRAVERAQAIGLDTLQVFTDNPMAWRRRAEPPLELPAFRARIAELGLGPIAIHAAYLVNLAGSDDALVARSHEMLASELRTAPSFGAAIVNVHMGSHRGTDAATGTIRLADGLAAVLAEVDDGPDAALLALENSAGGGDTIGTTVEEIAAILDAAAARGIPARRLGICLDTAHLWGAGHDISDQAGVDRLVERFAAIVGLDRLAMIHFNDSRSALGSRMDRHEHIGAGRIGSAGLRAVLCHPRLAHVPYFLETPGMDEGYDEVNATRTRALAAGLALADLGAEALEVRGSRSRSHPAADPGTQDPPVTDSRGRARRG